MKRLIITLALFLILSVSAVASNPAVRDGTVFTLDTMTSFQSNSWNYQQLMLLNQVWTDEERDQIAATVADDGGTLNLHFSPNMSLTIANLGLFANANVLAEATIPKNFTDLIFGGIRPEQLMEGGAITYSFDDFKGFATGYAQAGASLAATFGKVAVGVSGRYLLGLAFGQFHGAGEVAIEYQDNATDITSTDIGATGMFGQYGEGYAFDVGTSFQATEKLIVDASVLNIGQINWTEVEKYRWHRDGEHQLIKFGFNEDDFTFEFESDEFEEFLLEESETLPSYTLQLPLVVRLGTSYQLLERVSLGGEVRHTTFYHFPENFSTLRFAGSLESKLIKFLPMRLSVQNTSSEIFTIDGGLGLHLGPIQLDATVTNILGLLNQNTKGFGVALGTSLRF